MRKHLGIRLLAWLLILCSVVGLLPAVAVFEVKATDAIATETADLLNELATSYGTFTIPVNKEVTNYSSLDGVYFIRESGSGKTIDFSVGRASHKDRLTANTSSGSSAGSIYHLNSIGASGSNGGSLTAVNGKTPNNLDYAVEIKKHTEKIIWDTTTKYTDSDNKIRVGWAGYIDWEYYRDNAWSGDKDFGTYLGINKKPKTSDPVYSIKSLNTKRSSAPYLATDNAGGGMNYTSSAFPWFLSVNSTGASVKIYKVDPTGKSQFTFWLGIDTKNSNYISGHTISQIVREDRNVSDAAKYVDCNKQGFKFQYWDVFQVSPLTLELYRALEKAKPYVSGKNANGAYPAETYLNFLRYVKSAMTSYNAKRATWSSEKNADRFKLDAIAKDLTSHMELLDIETKPESYMDIPMEVLDFRADGLMFEFVNAENPFGLNCVSPSVAGVGNRPGTNVASEKGDGVEFVEGLIQTQLVDGTIRYSRETVTYIAQALYCQVKTFSDPAAKLTNYIDDFGPEDMDTYYNGVFMKMIDPNTGNRGSSGTAVRPSNYYFSTVGTYDQTMTKVNQNGGELRFNQVTTYFDLAYYILTYMWRETPSDDVVETVTKGGKSYALPYNMKIPELTTLRLLKNSSGKYVFSSDKANGRNLETGLIFNYDLTTSSGSTVPGFNAAAGLGFESESMLGNNSTGAKEDTAANIYGMRNYHVMYHVESAFVYYKDKNFSFSFTGDDDVYFFINGESVCEIGGTHSPAKRSVNLNGAVANKLGLEDGDICTFDMFMIDRHTNGINLNFETNIEMMPTGAVTDKVQYVYTKAGVIGEELPEGAVVADNSEIGYGFKLLNRNEHGAVDLSFVDKQLDVSLNGSNITLNGYAKVNELVVIYRTYDPHGNTFDSSALQSKTYGDMIPLLEDAIADMSSIVPLEEGSYILTGLTDTELKGLLALGLPANVQISIYGFHRTVQASVGGYTNTVVTACTPIRGKISDEEYVYGEPIVGYGIRNLNVQTMNTVTAEPVYVVIDYDKPVSFSIEEIFKAVSYDPRDVSLSFLGIRDAGEHEEIVFRVPEEIPLRYAGDTMTTDAGTYKQYTDYFRFTPNGLMEAVDRVYALVGVNDVYLGGVWYLTVEICVIPANVMYYEGENLFEAGDLSFTEKLAEASTEEPSEETEEPTEETIEPTEETIEPTEETVPDEEAPEGTEGDTIKFNHYLSYKTDGMTAEPYISDYSPVGKTNVVFFDFNTYSDSNNPYSGNAVYGGKNFGNVENWWSPGYGSIKSMSNGVITFETTNNDNPWGYIATGKAGSPVTTANAAQFPLQYKPSDNDWLEIRLKVDKSAAQNDTNTHLRVEFFTYSGDTDLKRAAVATKNFLASNINNGYFLLKFPIATTLENKSNPGQINYRELEIVRRMNFLIRGLDKSETFTTTIDYIYIGPEETCPSNMDGDEIYIGFEDTAEDRYRYTNPVYGGQLNYDKAPTFSGDSWLYTANRTPNGKFALSDGALKIPTGTVGGTNTNSPYIQTGYSGTMQNVMNYPAVGAETVRVRLKFENMTTALTDTEEYMAERGYPDYPVVRLGFVLDDDATYEDSACWVDWVISEEQLNGCDYMELTEDITQLLKDHEAKLIRAIRLTVVSAAGMEGKDGYVYVDEIYVGPKQTQDPNIYIAPSTTVIYDTPKRTIYYPDYDKSVIYFGFDNTTTDQNRYTNNGVYGNRNFDDKTNWWGPRYAKDTLNINIANGALTYTITPDNTWGYVATGKAGSDPKIAAQAEFPLTYVPGSSKEWFEIRMKVDGTVPSGGTGANFSFGLELFREEDSTAKGTYSKFSKTIDGSHIDNGYFTVAFELSDSTCNKSTDYILYSKQTIVRRMNLLIGSVEKGNDYSCSIDYVYLGPKEKSPSYLTADSVYFGFENDEYSLYHYNSTTYGGANYDQAANWRTGRIGTKSVSDGSMTYTVTKSVLNSDGSRTNGEPWFETQRGGGSSKMTMEFPTTKAKVAQLRVKFNGIDLVDPDKPVTLMVSFATAYILEPTTYVKEVEIPGAQVVTDGKWFTYSMDLAGLLPATGNITGIRIRFMNIHSEDEKGTITLDYIYVGPSLAYTVEEYRIDAGNVYGYDSSYTLDSLYSDNMSLYTEGRGVPLAKSDGSVDYDGTEQYTELKFSFVGTGFDLISRTGMNQGTIRVSVYSDPELPYESRERTVTMNLKGELELYQLPVVSVHGLEHGKHYVSIWVNDKLTAEDLSQLPEYIISGLLRGNEFYFDALRIYDPIDVTGQTLNEDQSVALEAYCRDKEADPYITEIRDLLLSKENFDTMSGLIDGAVFVDMKVTPPDTVKEDDEEGNTVGETTARPEDIVVSNHVTAKVKTYEKIGPKNEVYLDAGQAVAFRVAVNTTESPARLDVGAKIIQDGAAGNLVIGYVTAINGTSYTVHQIEEKKLYTSTAMYYETDLSALQLFPDGESQAIYMVIYNRDDGTGNVGVVSLTDVKVAYDSRITLLETEDSGKRAWTKVAPVQFLVDSNTVCAAESFVKTVWETPPAEDEDPDTDTEQPGQETEGNTTVENIRIYHSLNLASDISLNYLVPVADLEGYEDIEMICTLPVYENNALVGTKEIHLLPEERGDYYYFTLAGLTAVEMNDVVEATLTMSKAGQGYCAETDSYSIAQYAYSQLAKDGVADTLKTLCAELLRYGSAAQIYKDYRTDSLADAFMTEELRAWLSDTEAVTFDSCNSITGEGEDIGVTWAGKALLLDSKVAIRYVLDLSEFTGDVSQLKVAVSYTDLYGEEIVLTLENPVLYREENCFYSLDFDGLLAAELRQPVCAVVYYGETPVTGVLEYSVSTYGGNKTGVLGHLCKCLMAYSDSARAYFVS